MKEIEYWRTDKGIFIKTRKNGEIESSFTVDPTDERVPDEMVSGGLKYHKITIGDNDELPIRKAKTLVLAADTIEPDIKEVKPMKTKAEKKPEITQEELNAVEKKSDWVVSPNHYTQLKDELNGLECWDIYTILLRHKEHMPKHIAPLWANAFKYIWRVGDKPGDYGKTTEEKAIEDFEKVVAYCNKAIDELRKDIKK